ncbi:hypothetical protein E3T28_14075 [Cryobacterium sinapicolor]|uniref:Lipoprotein n=1 Tax=Cryobacterium sinapicolor TaxID=1259236 RepID=A0ABY2IUD2_9MICO|nr:hypothetical protein [Cryobacterium sinapicolor]TFC95065.1 hypothetical protein E3T28_14075 [Cryobacterium sinapicolor]
MLKRSGDTINFMRSPAQTCFAAVLVVILGTVITGCATQSQPDKSTQTPLASCDKILPKKLAQDILGRSGTVVQLHDKEPDAVDPLVDRMVTDGIACGGIVSEAQTSDGAVMIGQLAMNETQWAEAQSKFAADGHERVDEFVEGWVYVSKPSDDPTMGSGFAWRDGVLYYVQNPLILMLVPPFASEFADGAPPS